MSDLNNIENNLNPFAESETDKVDTEIFIKAIKMRDSADKSKRIKFDSEVNKKLILMMTYWDIDHSTAVAKAIHELYDNIFLSELNQLKK